MVWGLGLKFTPSSFCAQVQQQYPLSPGLGTLLTWVNWLGLRGTPLKTGL